MLLNGLFPPITTPFYPDGRVYFRKLEHNVDRYSKTPAQGIVVLGSTGEAILLSDQERREVLKTARQAAAADKVMIAGTGIESAAETLALTDYAAGVGYDVAMVRTPHYYKNQMKPLNMAAFYRTVADRSPLPIVIYNFPQATGYDIPVEVVVELADHPNVIGIKESCGVLDKVKAEVEGTGKSRVKRTFLATEAMAAATRRMLAEPVPIESVDLVPAAALGGGTALAAPRLKTRSKEVGFQVLVGSAQTLEPSLGLGAVGAILAFADCAPTACFEIYAAWKDGDNALAREKQARIAEAAKKVVGEYGIPGIKYAMDRNGYYGGVPRLPLLPPSAEIKADIDRLMAGIPN